MNKILLIGLLFLTLCSCKYVFVEKESAILKIEVNNNSSVDVQDASLYLLEKNEIGNDSTKIIIDTFSQIKSKGSISLRDYDIQKYSKGQRGNICFEVIKAGKVLEIVLWGYREGGFYTDSSYPGYNGFEITIEDTAGTNLEINKRFGRYVRGKRKDGIAD